MNTLDARGLSCPEPVIMMKRFVDAGAVPVQMTVDAPAARENVTRFARSQGCSVIVTEGDGEWTLVVTIA